ncbi:MAG: tRNA preQ1(34) S-adenosylmethionine ribosyltransferase-isomerase QueA [Desulfobacteraceae bacterium]|nr:MAG: tRNA preQ1(34) S-adenosylmethionine ribosyltransferase-isomerase QueA [Desulfobacteraceae bacterium]
MFTIEEYDYDLPEDLIAQVPAGARDQSRLLVTDRGNESLSDHFFSDLPGLLKPGDLLVVNNTKVIPARIYGRKESGGEIELLILNQGESNHPAPNVRWALLKASKRPKIGGRLLFDYGVTGKVEDLNEDGLTLIAFEGPVSIDTFLEKYGSMPLPPYIKRNRADERRSMDRERYQTIFSQRKGAVAAPTAGLHFTKNLAQALKEAGIPMVSLTLHVGHGTFRPVRVQDIREHYLGEESYLITPNTARAVNMAKREKRRVIAVGTTVVRTLESAIGPYGEIKAGKGKTGLLIAPGFRFQVVDGLITNFHLPKSSLLFLVSAFSGRKLCKSAYARAVKKRYRFYSYGDAMLIL